MVKIRLKRMGKKFNAFYRLVAADARAPRDGKFIEELGYFNPHSKELILKKDLIFKWLNVGAKPTETVKTLFKKEKIMQEFLQTKPVTTKTVKKPVTTKTVKKPVTTKTVKKPVTTKTVKKPVTKTAVVK